MLIGVAGALLLSTQVVAAQAFPNGAPNATQQWYLTQDRAWDHWPAEPHLATIKVAVIDTGIDGGNPAFAGRVAAGKSFVGGSWQTDILGHGTFVAGIIGAHPAGGSGISGLAFNAKLLIAKVVSNTDPLVVADAESKAIYWAVSQGARVINLSIGAQRDPDDPFLDGYSQAEETAIEYAYSKGVLVVAAAGNGTDAPKSPWGFADYPAALPHVLGVAALNQDGSVPDFSNRDPQYVDIAAPGAGIFSTIPRSLVDTTAPNCDGAPYSNCGPSEFQDAIGTSFAAPQVSAAAALLLGVNPKLTPDQLAWILERSATDEKASNGCAPCPTGRDALTGWGRLDVDRAISLATGSAKLPGPDAYEPNDDIRYAHPLGHLPWTLTASEDYWDDPIDVYAVALTAGEQLSVSLSGPARKTSSLILWRPGTLNIASGTASYVAARSSPAKTAPHLAYTALGRGIYYVEVKDLAPSRNRSIYRLVLDARPAG